MNPLAPPPLQHARRRLLYLMGAAALAPLPALAGAAAPLPGDSVYQLHATLTDQDGHALDLASERGTPVLASMFYTSCQMTCPLTFETIARTLDALPPADRARVRVLMISFDSARDTVEVLRRTAREHGCDARWTLARGDEASIRKVAAVLGVQYRRLPDGDFNHATVVQLLDAEGRVAARSEKLGAVDPQLLAALSAQLHPAG